MTFEKIQEVNKSITTVDIKGKAYAEVNQRIKAFRMLYPEGTIETEIISYENNVVVIKAYVKDGDRILGTGHAYEKEGNGFINKTSYIENCETSAVGRALAMIGLGIEANIASSEEVQNAQLQQLKPKDDSKEECSVHLEDVPEHKPTTLDECMVIVDAIGYGDKIDEFCKIYKVNELTELTQEQLEDFFIRLVNTRKKIGK